MSSLNYTELLQARLAKGLRLCTGLDLKMDKIPPHLAQLGPCDGLRIAGIEIAEATVEHTAVFKPNAAFYERHGWEGWNALKEIVQHILHCFPEVPIILDGKRGDIGDTSVAYAEGLLEHLGCHAITLNPMLGEDAVEPFLRNPDKGCIFLGRTSNLGAADFQDLILEDGSPLWMRVTTTVAKWHEKYGNCSLVFGAKHPEVITKARKVMGSNMSILAPGASVKQGGNSKVLEEAVKACGPNGTYVFASDICNTGSAEASGQKAKEISELLAKLADKKAA